MSLALTSKAKAALLAAIQGAALSDLAGFHYHRGLRTGLQKVPALCLGIIGREPLFEHELEGPWKLTADITVETRAAFDSDHASSTSEDAHDTAVAAVEDFVRPPTICPLVNAENLTRPVTAFYLHSTFLRPTIATGFDVEKKLFISYLTFNFIVENRDCTTA